MLLLFSCLTRVLAPLQSGKKTAAQLLTQMKKTDGMPSPKFPFFLAGTAGLSARSHAKGFFGLWGFLMLIGAGFGVCLVGWSANNACLKSASRGA